MGILYIPEHASGLVLFEHESGNSRFSVRNQFVAQRLNQSHIATLLFDLLTPEEERIDVVPSLRDGVVGSYDFFTHNLMLAEKSERHWDYLGVMNKQTLNLTAGLCKLYSKTICI